MTSEPDLQAVREAVDDVFLSMERGSSLGVDFKHPERFSFTRHIIALAKFAAARLAEPAEAGKGEVPPPTRAYEVRCPECGGDGVIAGDVCSVCNGDGCVTHAIPPTPAPAPEMVEVVARALYYDHSRWADKWDGPRKQSCHFAAARAIAALQSAGHLVPPGHVVVPVEDVDRLRMEVCQAQAALLIAFDLADAWDSECADAPRGNWQRQTWGLLWDALHAPLVAEMCGRQPATPSAQPQGDRHG
jgi:hypothetical protein